MIKGAERGERKGKETNRQFEKEGLRLRAPHFFFNFLDPTLGCSHCVFKSSGYDNLELKHKIWFYKLMECFIKIKKSYGVKKNEKMCAIGGTECNETCNLYLRRTKNDQREKGWWRGRGERIEKGSRERIEIERKETKGTIKINTSCFIQLVHLAKRR